MGKNARLVRQIVRVYQAMFCARVDDGVQWLWVREIARLAEMHPETVPRILSSYMREIVEELDVELLMSKGLRIRPVWLKNRVNIEGQIRFLRAMSIVRLRPSNPPRLRSLSCHALVACIIGMGGWKRHDRRRDPWHRPTRARLRGRRACTSSCARSLAARLRAARFQQSCCAVTRRSPSNMSATRNTRRTELSWRETGLARNPI